jgi:hypothetical protein
VFSTLLRRALLGELQEEREAANIFSANNLPALVALIHSVPLHSPAERLAWSRELQLPPEEEEMELANWPYRHQSVGGDLLIREQLVPFRLIRLQAYGYLLLCSNADPEISETFTRAFAQPPRAQTERAFGDGERTWAAWAWFLNPDPAEAELAAENLRQLWGKQEP